MALPTAELIAGLLRRGDVVRGRGKRHRQDSSCIQRGSDQLPELPTNSRDSWSDKPEDVGGQEGSDYSQGRF